MQTLPLEILVPVKLLNLGYQNPECKKGFSKE